MSRQPERRKPFGRGLMALGVLLALISMCLLGEQLWEYRRSEQYYAEAEAEAVTVRILPEEEDLSGNDPDGGSAGGPQSIEVPISVDFAKLTGAEGTCIGWIYSSGTPISYPIGYSGDNSYFLTRSLDGESCVAGAIFLDGRCHPDFSDPHSILYGHCMKSGAMFGSLLQYKEQEYYEAHPYFWLITPEVNYQVFVFAVCVVSSESESEFWQVEFTGREDIRMKAWLEAVQQKSRIRPRYSVPEGARLLTLSTCSYEFETARCLVIGYLQEQ